MTQLEFEALQPGDVIVGPLGVRGRIVRQTSYGYQIRKDDKKLGKAITPSKWRKA